MMGIKHRIFMRKILFFLFVSHAFCSVNQNNDVQFWPTVSLEKKCSEEISIRSNFEVRIGNDISKAFFVYAEAFLVYRPFQWLYIAPGYRQIFNNQMTPSGKWRPVYSPLADIKFIGIFQGFGVINRNRVHYLLFEHQSSKWLYRNRLRFTYQFERNTWKYQPFIDEEVFFIERRGFFQNKASIGVVTFPIQEVSIRTYYLLRHIKVEDHFRHQNILGLQFCFLF